MVKRILVYFILVAAAACALLSCATSGRLITISDMSIIEADSLFHVGDYVNAKRKYTKIRDTENDTNRMQDVQFKLGYLNVYAHNPFGDWEDAIREFSRYQSTFPNGKRIEEVNSWLTLLHSVKSFDDGYQAAVKQVDECKNKSGDENKKSGNIMDALLKCDAARDSLTREVDFLNRKVTDLTDLILRLQSIGKK